MLITDFCKIFSGVSFPKTPIAEELGDYLVLESHAISKKGIIDSSLLKAVTNKQFSMPSNRLLKEDILIRAKGFTFQAILFNEELSLPIVPTSYFLILRINDKKQYNPKFITNLLNQEVYQSNLTKLSGGSTVKHLTKKRLSELTISLPTLDIQEQLLELAPLKEKEIELQNKAMQLRSELYSYVEAEALEKGND